MRRRGEPQEVRDERARLELAGDERRERPRIGAVVRVAQQTAEQRDRLRGRGARGHVAIATRRERQAIGAVGRAAELACAAEQLLDHGVRRPVADRRAAVEIA